MEINKLTDKNHLDLLWNSAVRKVGTKINSTRNFQKIATVFITSAIFEDISEAVIQSYLTETFEAVRPFFVKHKDNCLGGWDYPVICECESDAQ